MSTERIANRQLFSILFLLRSTLAVSTLPTLTTADARQDAWLSLLLYLPVALALVWLLGSLGSRFPRKTLAQYSSVILGPWLGRPVTAVYLWIFLFFAALEVRIYAEMIISGFLPETPLVFIIFTMVFVAAAAAWLGLEVIGRMVDILFPLFLITMLLSILIPLPLADPGNLQPLLGRGWGPLVRATLTPLGNVLQFSVLAFIAPSVVRPRRALGWILGAMAVGTFFAFASAAVVVMVKGAEEGARAIYPVLSMVRAVRVSPVLERAEVFTVFGWGLGIFISLSAYLYAGARGVAQFFNIRDYRPLVAPMSVIWVVLGVHILDDIFQLRDLSDYRVGGLYGLLLLLTPLALLWTVYGVRRILHKLSLPGGLPRDDREEGGEG